MIERSQSGGMIITLETGKIDRGQDACYDPSPEVSSQESITLPP